MQLQAAARLHDGSISEIGMNSALALIEAAEPRNEIEGALALQMACTHIASMAILGSFAGERRALHGAGMDGDFLAGLRIPDARGLVIRRRYHPLAVAAARIFGRNADPIFAKFRRALEPLVRPTSPLTGSRIAARPVKS